MHKSNNMIYVATVMLMSVVMYKDVQASEPNQIKHAPVVPEPANATKVSNDLLKSACLEAVLKEINPSNLQAFDIRARALDDDNFSCLVSGKQTDSESARRSYQMQGITLAPIEVQYAVGGNIKTWKFTVARTDIGKAKENASMALAGMFFDLTPTLVEPRKAVFDAKIAGGKRCTVTMIQEGDNEAVQWLASDVHCGNSKSIK